MRALHGLWELNFLTRDRTWAAAVKVPSPNHWTASESPDGFLILVFCALHSFIRNIPLANTCHVVSAEFCALLACVFSPSSTLR